MLHSLHSLGAMVPRGLSERGDRKGILNFGKEEKTQKLATWSPKGSFLGFPRSRAPLLPFLSVRIGSFETSRSSQATGLNYAEGAVLGSRLG